MTPPCALPGCTLDTGVAIVLPEDADALNAARNAERRPRTPQPRRWLGYTIGGAT